MFFNNTGRNKDAAAEIIGPIGKPLPKVSSVGSSSSTEGCFAADTST